VNCARLILPVKTTWTHMKKCILDFAFHVPNAQRHLRTRSIAIDMKRTNIVCIPTWILINYILHIFSNISFLINNYFILDIINSPAKPNQVKTSLNTFVPYVQADLLEKNPNNLWTGDDLCIRAMDSFEKTNTSCNSGKIFENI